MKFCLDIGLISMEIKLLENKSKVLQGQLVVKVAVSTITLAVPMYAVNGLQ